MYLEFINIILDFFFQSVIRPFEDYIMLPLSSVSWCMYHARESKDEDSPNNEQFSHE